MISLKQIKYLMALKKQGLASKVVNKAGQFGSFAAKHAGKTHVVDIEATLARRAAEIAASRAGRGVPRAKQLRNFGKAAFGRMNAAPKAASWSKLANTAARPFAGAMGSASAAAGAFRGGRFREGANLGLEALRVGSTAAARTARVMGQQVIRRTGLPRKTLPTLSARSAYQAAALGTGVTGAYALGRRRQRRQY